MGMAFEGVVPRFGLSLDGLVPVQQRRWKHSAATSETALCINASRTVILAVFLVYKASKCKLGRRIYVPLVCTYQTDVDDLQHPHCSNIRGFKRTTAICRKCCFQSLFRTRTGEPDNRSPQTRKKALFSSYLSTGMNHERRRLMQKAKTSVLVGLRFPSLLWVSGPSAFWPASCDAARGLVACQADTQRRGWGGFWHDAMV